MGTNFICCTSSSSTKTFSDLLKKKPKDAEEAKCQGTAESPLGLCIIPKSCTILKSVSDEDLRGIYTFEKRLGIGRFGVVNQVYLNKDRNKKFAVKSIKISSIMSDFKLIENELDILMQVDHPNIIKYYETYNDGKYLHIVMELCNGGELFDRIIKQGKFSEAEAAKIIEKILSALSYLHNLGICHRDLKPENFIFNSREGDAEIKIIDFGLSIKPLKGANMNDIVGTSYYVAPEVLAGVYSIACDVWSIGVILYIMLSGKPPFSGETSSEVLGKVSRAVVCFPEKNWVGVSSEAKDLIFKMLEKDTKLRLTAKQCLEHAWFKKYEDPSSTPLDIKLLKRLKNFRKMPRLKQEILGIVIKFLHPLMVKHYTNNFRALDQNDDGYITSPDLTKAAKEHGVDLTEGEADTLVKNLDLDKDGNFSISDFVAAAISESQTCTEEMAKLAFDHLDVHKDGFITLLDLIKAFKRGAKKYTDAEIKLILEEVDFNKDGKISFPEFREIILK